MRIKLLKPMILSEIAAATGATLKARNKYVTVSYLTTDSREILPGDLFVCIKGEKYDGEYFASEALKKGAYLLSREQRKNSLRVEDTRAALLSLANYGKRLLRGLKKTVAVTGSVGKTTTKEFIRTIAEADCRTHATEGNLNNDIGVPMTILSAPQDTKLLVLEMGMNSSGEISRLSKSTEPDIGIITCIGTAHIGRLGSRENIARAKLEILDGMRGGRLIIPYGEPLLPTGDGAFTFSASNNSADLYITRNKGNAKISVKGDNAYEAPFKPDGEHNLSCLGAAVSACHLCGISVESIKNGISLISNDITRQSIIKVGNFYILNDSYNASYESIIAAFELMSSYKDYTQRSVVIGDILELGNEENAIYGRLGEAIQKYGFNRVFLVGNCCEVISGVLIKGGFPINKIHTNEDYTRLDYTASEILRGRSAGELILLKASHKIRLGGLVDLLKAKAEG